MRIDVQFFSQLRDIAGSSSVEVEVSEGTRMAQLLEILYESYPRLRAWDDSILLGAGVEFVDRAYLLRPNENIAIMPPVQGG